MVLSIIDTEIVQSSTKISTSQAPTIMFNFVTLSALFVIHFFKYIILQKKPLIVIQVLFHRFNVEGDVFYMDLFDRC